MRLIIAEKPSLARAIAAGVGGQKSGKGSIQCNGNTVVTWCLGHLLEQKAPDDYSPEYKEWLEEHLPIIPEKWGLKVASRSRDQFKVVKDLIGKATEIVNAGDPDREGSLLVDEVVQFCGKKADKRLLVADLNIGPVKKALSKIQPNSVTSGLTAAALARSRADWLVGMNLTRAFSLAAQRNGARSVMSIGRVQTPLLGLIVRRDLEIENFVSHPYYGITGVFSNTGKTIEANWVPIAAESYLDDKGRIIDKDYVEDCKGNMHGKEAVVSKVDKKKVVSKPPSLFSLSELQKAANKAFGMTAKQTLDAAQSLYEKHQLTTYPRSDCQYLPKDQFNDAENIVNSMLPDGHELLAFIGSANYETPSPAFNDSKVGAHHAIVPTGEWKNQELSSSELNVYSLVCRQYLAQFLGNKTSANTEIVIRIGDSDYAEFKAKGSVVEVEGFAVLFKNSKDKLLPDVKEGDQLDIESLELVTSNTTPPKHFTESSLLDAMTGIAKYCEDQSIIKHLKDTDGLGTEATRATMIELIIKREFVARDKKNFVSTPHGRNFILSLPKELTIPDSTALWESKLNKIAEKEMRVQDFLEGIEREVHKFVKVAETTELKDNREKFDCPKCGSEFRRIKKKAGGFFWACSDRENCGHTAEDKRGKPDLNTKQHDCPKCGKELKKRKGANGDFWGCTGFKDGCKYTAPNKRNKPDFEAKAKPKKEFKDELADCPICSEKIKRLYSKKNDSYFWVHVKETENCKKYIKDNEGSPVK